MWRGVKEESKIMLLMTGVPTREDIENIIPEKKDWKKDQSPSSSVFRGFPAILVIHPAPKEQSKNCRYYTTAL
jgi:hypothetical protein